MKDTNRETELRLLEEKIICLSKELSELNLLRAKLVGMDTGTRKSPRTMLDRKARARLILDGANNEYKPEKRRAVARQIQRPSGGLETKGVPAGVGRPEV